jgi:non-heme chloroperoxidase
MKRAGRFFGVLPFFYISGKRGRFEIGSEDDIMRKNVFQPIRQDGEGKRTGWVVSTHGARIYVETAGSGPVILLVHGWTMSGKFWLRQLTGLSDRFQVVTMDLRAHGNSSKTFEGHTMECCSEDVQAVITALKLENVVLAGWSLGGPVVLEYWRRFGDEKLSALALVEMTPFPFSPEKWNTHALKGYNFESMHSSFRALEEDRNAFGERFIHNMFKEGQAPTESFQWMLQEHLKTPTPAAMAVYSDYVMGDFTGVLKSISIPTLAIYGDSTHFCFGPKTGRYVAEQVPGCRLEVLDQSGHMPFYEQPEEFNNLFADLALRNG